MNDLTPPPIPGYLDVEFIGSGGSAAVWRAWESGLDRYVAIKVPHHDDPVALNRFENERLVLGPLGDHPNVITMFQSGTTASGMRYMVSEFCAGGSTKALVRQHGPLDVDLCIDIGIAVAGALAAAHQGPPVVLHRDVKPENILINSYGDPVLADFGIAIASLRGSERTTTVTPSHVAPEILSGSPHTVRADIYSLGSTLYELLTGHSPFHRKGEPIDRLLKRVQVEEVPPIGRADVPDYLDQIIMAMLAKRPQDRPESARLLAAQLRDAQNRRGDRPTVAWLPASPLRPPVRTQPPEARHIDLRERSGRNAPERRTIDLRVQRVKRAPEVASTA